MRIKRDFIGMFDGIKGILMLIIVLIHHVTFASAVENGDADLGIAMCGTGNGMAMTLNKHRNIRAGLAWNTEIGALVKQHNNANILVMPARFISFDEIMRITDTWLNSEFEGGRHQKRIDKIPVRQA